MTTSKHELHRIRSLIRQVQAKGKEVPTELLHAAQEEYTQGILGRLVSGHATNEETLALVEYHWPHLLENQEIAIDQWQGRIIRHILSGRKTNMNQVFVKGCTKAGKGFSVAIAACLWYQSAEECKVIVTSNTSTHAQQVMFGEILSLRKRMVGACKATHGLTMIKQSEKKFMTVVSPEHGESFSGSHGPATMFLFDEASGTVEEFFNLAETQSAMIVALSNPRNATGWFRAAFPSHNPDETQVIEIPGGRRALHTIGGLDCINVIEKRLVIPTQIDFNRYQSIKAKDARWGRVFGDGKFPEEDENLMVIAPSWLERHHRAWTSQMPVQAFGLDMAASDTGDRSELACGGSAGCHAIHEKKSIDTMEVVGWVIRIIQEKHGINLKEGLYPIAVDCDGLGKGAADRLAEVGCWVIEFRGNASSKVDPKTYANLRAEAYGELGNRLNPKGAWPDEAWAIPRDSELEEDLCAPERIYLSDGIKFRLTPKSSSRSYRGQTLQQKLGRSPDKGDAVAYLYHAVRDFLKGAEYQELQAAPLIASGDDPEERKPLTDEEVEELPDWLKDIVVESRETAKTSVSFGCRDSDGFEDDILKAIENL
jgi:hypothetical protein